MDNGNNVATIKNRLDIAMADMEKLQSENRFLKSELDKLNKLYSVSMEFCGMIEDELYSRACIPDNMIKNNEAAEKKSDSREILKMKSDLMFERADKEKIILENKYLKKELNKVIQLQTLTVSHDSELQNDMDNQLKEAKQLAITDHLTRIYNRFWFYKSLTKELDMNRVHNIAISLIMFDIDHFKLINDTYGHDKGDYLLVKIVELVGKKIRRNDIFSRWGGEEFMILLPGSDLEQTTKIAENIRSTIESYRFDIKDQITCSFGVTQLVASDTIKSLLKRVDDAMYKAKDKGRNCVVVI